MFLPHPIIYKILTVCDIDIRRYFTIYNPVQLHDIRFPDIIHSVGGIQPSARLHLNIDSESFYDVWISYRKSNNYYAFPKLEYMLTRYYTNRIPFFEIIDKYCL